MRMKTVDAIRTVVRWIQGFLEVRLPIDIAAGLRRADGSPFRPTT
jgi:hypothetical protein